MTLLEYYYLYYCIKKYNFVTLKKSHFVGNGFCPLIGFIYWFAGPAINDSL